MKKLYIFFLLIPFCTLGQSFNSFGKLRIGGTISDLCKMLEINKIPILNDDNKFDRKLSKARRAELEEISSFSSDKVNLIKIDGSKFDLAGLKKKPWTDVSFISMRYDRLPFDLREMPGTNLYLLKNYSVAGFKFEEVFLATTNDSIQLIDIPGGLYLNEVAKLLVKKYSPNENFNKLDTIPCKMVLTGVENDKYALHNEIYWLTGDCSASYIRRSSYNSDCEVSSIDEYLHIVSKKFLTKMNSYLADFDKVKGLQKAADEQKAIDSL